MNDIAGIIDIENDRIRFLSVVHRRIQRIHLAVHYLFGFASTSANRPDRSVGVDAVACTLLIDESVGQPHHVLETRRILQA